MKLAGGKTLTRESATALFLSCGSGDKLGGLDVTDYLALGPPAGEKKKKWSLKKR